jgi:hypothetical protein
MVFVRVLPDTASFLPADVAETAAASAVIDVLELNFNTVGRVNQNLDGIALPYPRLRARAVFSEPLDDLVRSEPLDAESDMRPECCRPASLDHRRTAARDLPGGWLRLPVLDTSAASSFQGIELEREAIGVVEVNAVYCFALSQNRLSGCLHFPRELSRLNRH